ncbi:MAG: hypothetical protein ACYTAF_07960 [Planctomycetota bacterium]|jgi:hypothetical protein
MGNPSKKRRREAREAIRAARDAVATFGVTVEQAAGGIRTLGRALRRADPKTPRRERFERKQANRERRRREALATQKARSAREAER